MDDLAALRLCATASDGWRRCDPAQVAGLTQRGLLVAGQYPTNEGRRLIGLRPIRGMEPMRRGVPQYAR